ncbi:hypothetical protein CCHR01_18286 [Colletotrichum chrysophilum]|uniref:Uncharacterized protein n=1 Tax=Colletotrichum chrysophilum TaxID=1836956 RepID=A0AAD9E8S6_9PEZI|nr:hypothetical protein CCHR01_18286 [Colletotrichum chrysophilum]
MDVPTVFYEYQSLDSSSRRLSFDFSPALNTSCRGLWCLSNPLDPSSRGQGPENVEGLAEAIVAAFDESDDKLNRVRRHRDTFPAWIFARLQDHLDRVLAIVYGEHWEKIEAKSDQGRHQKKAATSLGLSHPHQLYVWYGEQAVASRRCWQADWAVLSDMSAEQLFDSLLEVRIDIVDSQRNPAITDNYLEHPFASRDFAKLKNKRKQPRAATADTSDLHFRPKANLLPVPENNNSNNNNKESSEGEHEDKDPTPSLPEAEDRSEQPASRGSPGGTQDQGEPESHHSSPRASHSLSRQDKARPVDKSSTRQREASEIDPTPQGDIPRTIIADHPSRILSISPGVPRGGRFDSLVRNSADFEESLAEFNWVPPSREDTPDSGVNVPIADTASEDSEQFFDSFSDPMQADAMTPLREGKVRQARRQAMAQSNTNAQDILSQATDMLKDVTNQERVDGYYEELVQNDKEEAEATLTQLRQDYINRLDRIQRLPSLQLLEVVRESIQKLSDIIEEPLPPRFDDEDGTLGLNGLPQTFGQRDAPVDAWNAQAAADQRERVRSSSAGSSEKQDELSSKQSTSDKLSTNGSDGHVRDREAEFQHLSTADRELDDDDASASIDRY